MWPTLWRRIAARAQLQGDLTAAFEDGGLTFWLTPGATGPAPEGLQITGDHIFQMPW